MTANMQNRVDAEARQALDKISRKKRLITAVLYIGALILGAFLGFIGNADLNQVLNFIATVFTRLFSFIAVPVIAVSLINTLARLNHGSNGGTIFTHTIFYTLLTTTVFTRLFSFIAVPVIAVSLINTLARLNHGSNGGTIFTHTIFYTLLTTILAATVGLSLFLILAPTNVPQEMIGTAANSNGGTIFTHTIFYTLLTTILAATVGLSLFLILAPTNVPQEMIGTAANPTAGVSTSYLDHIISIVPNNFLQPFVSGNVLSILLVAAAVGLGIASLKSSEGRTALVKVLTGIQDLLFILIHWLITILPLGIVAFTAQLVTQLEAGVILGGLATYFAAVISSNLLQMFIILPVILLLRRLNPLKVLRGMLPALVVALFSKSSAGTLPVTIASAEDNLNIDKRISRFVLPICTTINMNGCAAFILITSLYLLQNAGIELNAGSYIAWIFIATFAAVGNAGVPMGCYFLAFILITSLYLLQNAGIELNAGSYIAWIFIATFAAVGNAGVPMGCYFLTLSLVSSMNVPVALMGVILPIYAVIDMIETCLNVWSDSCVANIVNEELKDKLPKEELTES